MRVRLIETATNKSPASAADAPASATKKFAHSPIAGHCTIAEVGSVQYGLMLSAPRSCPGIHTGGELGSSGGVFPESVAFEIALIQICLHSSVPFATHDDAVFCCVSLCPYGCSDEK